MTTSSEHPTVQLHPSGHVDGFTRAQLPPAEQWPVITLEGVYAVPPRLNAAVELLDRAISEGHGDRVAIVVPDGIGGWEETTYAQLAAQVDALAHVLVHDLGLVGAEDAERMQKLLDVLEDLDDVQEVSHNAAL